MSNTNTFFGVAVAGTSRTFHTAPADAAAAMAATRKRRTAAADAASVDWGSS